MYVPSYSLHEIFSLMIIFSLQPCTHRLLPSLALIVHLYPWNHIHRFLGCCYFHRWLLQERRPWKSLESGSDQPRYHGCRRARHGVRVVHGWGKFVLQSTSCGYVHDTDRRYCMPTVQRTCCNPVDCSRYDGAEPV